MRLLIAEDDKLHRTFLESLARNTFAELEELTLTSDGSGAIEAFKSSQYDCVLLDLQMPKVTGVDVAKSIWAKARQRRSCFGRTTPKKPIFAV
ncbi:response regulator [Phaeobacter sp. J2-8]|uniref:response regulator n=1 Tax=Phaeobacter sp. J2-8 TaxID=2931394 RepID=UPI001FD33A5A|nr:response regulator [Phaeobacter sp. J2-8]MCJ7873112.1 response regulator [Phaeobacter sp. J2-8]